MRLTQRSRARANLADGCLAAGCQAIVASRPLARSLDRHSRGGLSYAGSNLPGL